MLTKSRLQVFHELHCLNFLRKLIYPDVYGKIDYKGQIHANHCIDHIRRIAECGSNATPVVYTGYKNGNLYSEPETYTCRNFTLIRQWAEMKKIQNTQ
ncbi:hypothetical protein COCVIDRAFT_116867 [Bipolaris victoriae FI3]|uniref:UstYa family oxidase VicYc n=1 Tax=Bipolaris victoriae (strain FI3) TaxID=930091 RepID=VICYC_BIPV3|nr:hypothetical protein COCVIDRAFT_116867 [Bipolaris victoriae FI3]W7DZP2.1 RecName: Full=UstYa family oxidase VicYc; AltName: Full=Victorin biosynthesis cluster protein Yc [Bipolaris victoriae FI3]